MTLSRLFSFAVACAFLALPAAHAQPLLDDFDDGDFGNVFAFSEFGGAGVGIGPVDGPSGSAALRVDLNPAEAGAFAGFGFAQPAGGTIDASGAAYFSFFLRANVDASNTPIVLELNLQEDVGNDGYDPLVDDEFQAKLLIDISDDCWQLVKIPVSAFTDDNSVNVGSDDGFDFGNTLQFVAAIGGLTGPAFSIDIDEVGFRSSTPSVTQEVVYNDFEGDVGASVFTFSETGIGIGVGPTAPAPGASGSTQALSVGLNPAETGSFAGFVIIPPGGGTVSVSPNDYIGFWLRPVVNATNTPLILEINLHEDPDMNGIYDGATEDEFQANYLVEASDAGTWQFVAIPVAAFTDDNAVFPGSDDGFDYNKLLEIVVAIGGLTGDEYQIELDDVVFGDCQAAVVASIEATGTTVFPPSGGPLAYRVSLTNTTSTSQTVSARIDATLPNGDAFGPIQGPRTVTIPAGGTFGPFNLSENVPGIAPAGTYCFNITLTQGGFDFEVDSFTFMKTAAESAASQLATSDAAYPNPFRTTTTIPYAVDATTEVRLAVYDVMGREVAVLVDGTVEAGRHEARFDGRDLASGVYVWRLTAGTETQTGRLTLAR